MIKRKSTILPLTVLFLFASTVGSTENTTHEREKRQFLDCSSPMLGDGFGGPRVHLTVSSLVALADGGRRLLERQLELNWHQASPVFGDWVGLFAQDPSLNQGLGPAIDRVDVSGRSTGFFRTSVTFPRPTFSARALRTECLGFWISYVRDNRSLSSQCLRNRPSWMWDNRHTLGPLTLRDLVIPGTHDSGSYQEYQGRASENVITRYTICQDENVWNQLAYGIRYLDFRVGLYTTTRERFWLNHGDFKINPLQRALTDLSAFLNATQEIVVLDIHRFQWGFDSRDEHRELVALLLRELEPHMVPRSANSDTTLAQMWAVNKRLLVSYNDAAFLENNLLWPGIPQRWGDKNDASSLKIYLQSVMHLPSDYLWVAMAELTPTTADIIGNPSGSLRVLADKVNKNVSAWVRELWWDKANVVAADFFLSTNIIEVSIEANLRRKLCRDRIAPPALPVLPAPPAISVPNQPGSPAIPGPPAIPSPPGPFSLPLPNRPHNPGPQHPTFLHQPPNWNQPMNPSFGPGWLAPRYPPPIPQPVVSGPPPYRQLELAHRFGLAHVPGQPTWYDTGSGQIFPMMPFPFPPQRIG